MQEKKSNSYLVHFIGIFALSFPTSGCKKDDDSPPPPPPLEESTDETNQIETETTSGTKEEITHQVLERRKLPEVNELSLITPEQFLAATEKGLGLNDLQFRREALRDHGVALGGIDFKATYHRNYKPTGQSLLSVHRLAWEVSNKIMELEANRQGMGEDRLVFIKARMADRPIMPIDDKLGEVEFSKRQESQIRFLEQIDYLHWVLFTRAASEQEKELITKLFRTTYLENESKTKLAWTVVLYTLLSSMEFWYL